MDCVSPIALKIQTQVDLNGRKFNIETKDSYRGLFEELRNNRVYQGAILEYFSDSGEKVQIKDDQSYLEFLACSNGFFNYLECKSMGDQNSLGPGNNNVIWDTTKPWDCIYCHFNNKPDAINCLVCSKPRIY